MNDTVFLAMVITLEADGSGDFTANMFRFDNASEWDNQYFIDILNDNMGCNYTVDDLVPGRGHFGLDTRDGRYQMNMRETTSEMVPFIVDHMNSFAEAHGVSHDVKDTDSTMPKPTLH